jgi:hypothetical protein
MKIYTSAAAAVAHLKEKGYNNEFHLYENNLLWVQEKALIRNGAFSIQEWHLFRCDQQKGPVTIVFGILLKENNARGILLNDYSKYSTQKPAVIQKKLSDMYEQKISY